MDLPPLTTPEGLFQWLIGLIVFLAALFLVVFYFGLL
jgi:hypothetical protein